MIGIYLIKNNLNGKGYVGQSIHIEERWKEHVTHQNTNSLIHKAIKKYGIKNFTFSVLEECTVDQLDEKEIYWISELNTYQNGYNLTAGGSGQKRYDIEKIYEKYLENNNMNETAKIFNCSVSTVRRVLRIFGINKYEVSEAKIIEKIDPKTLEVITSYSSMSEAAEAAKVSLTGMHKAVYTPNYFCKGFYWRQQGSNKELKKVNNNSEIRRMNTKINQLDLDGNYIQSFASPSEAGEFLGKGRKNGGTQIALVCRGKRITAYGYKWEYAE